MPLFRKKPVVIEAERLESASDAHRIGMWSGAQPVYAGGELVAMDIMTREGTMRASMGDWIIKGVKGEFYPCKPEIFDETYEPAALSDRARKIAEGGADTP